MSRLVPFLSISLLLVLPPAPATFQNPRQQKEELQDTFRKWLREDVVYIITAEERQVFESLQTEAEKQLFIEQFWARRDPDPGTSSNEGREEHYRRIQYANDFFGSGEAGWRSDRGRIYIVFGPPDRLDSFPSGRVYNRPLSRGGGRTTTLPYESWWYDFLPGVGSGIEIEFVDASLAGRYKLALGPDEKDAMAHVPGAGETLLESLELTVRRLRAGPYGDPFSSTYADQPFIRLHRYDQVQRPKDIRSLSGEVTTRIQFSQLGAGAAVHYLRRNPELLTVPVTITVAQDDLQYERPETSDIWVSRVSVYGKVQAVNGQVVREFEERFRVNLSAAEYEDRQGKSAFYQKMLDLSPGRFKLSLIIQDEASGKLSTSENSVILPESSPAVLDASPLILATSVEPEEGAGADVERAFRLSGYRVYPSTDRRFAAGKPVGVYVEAYPSSGTGPENMRPSATIRLLREGGEAVVKQFDVSSSLERVDGRWLFAGLLPTSDLEAGRYLLQAEIRSASGETVSRQGSFTLIP